MPHRVARSGLISIIQPNNSVLDHACAIWAKLRYRGGEPAAAPLEPNVEGCAEWRRFRAVQREHGHRDEQRDDSNRDHGGECLRIHRLSLPERQHQRQRDPSGWRKKSERDRGALNDLKSVGGQLERRIADCCRDAIDMDRNVEGLEGLALLIPRAREPSSSVARCMRAIKIALL